MRFFILGVTTGLGLLLVGVFALIIYQAVIIYTSALSLSVSIATQTPTIAPVFNLEAIVNVNSVAAQVIINASIQSWRQVFNASHPGSVTIDGTWCGYTFPTPRTIDDVLVEIAAETIDGAYGILGYAGPCALDSVGMPRFGRIVIDLVDLDRMLQDGVLGEVVRHEIGHVLGIGTLWTSGVTYMGTLPVTGGYAYLLPAANAADLILRGVGIAAVEDTGGAGTAGGHWKETVYDTELMTGYVEASGIPMPLSILTLGGLIDLGYSVDPSSAESYTAPLKSGRRMLRLKNKIPLEGCMMRNSIQGMLHTKPKVNPN